MSDGPIETVVEPVNDVVDDVSSDTPPDPQPHDERPPWVDELIAQVAAVGDAVTAMAPNPLNTDQVPTPVETAEELHDQSPVKEPWTHRKLLGRSE